MKIGMVAGEASGDQLGATLIAELRRRLPDVQCVGVGGPKMRAQGLEAWADAESLAVMGLLEVVPHLPRLLRLRRALVRRFTALRPDVFIGVDYKEFNLGLARRLKAAGIATVQYVSPQVWAWRQSRVRTIGEACDLMLCLLPFEPAFYANHGVRAEFVGHPLADLIPLEPDRAAARAALGIDPAVRVVALLPGSRHGEVSRLGPDFAGAAAWLAARHPELRFIAPMASGAVRSLFERACAERAAGVEIQLIDGDAHRALAAADAVLVASGTATLETLLSKRPMVVAYRFSALTAGILRMLRLVKLPYYSQPNLLAGRQIVPEFIQEAVTPEALGSAIEAALEDASGSAAMRAEFLRIHHELRRDGAAGAVDAVLELVRRRRA
jgi:lipid-A-disaccharide synthase